MIYTIKFMWQGTSTTVLIKATSEDEAVKKATRQKRLRGAWEYKILRVEPE